MTTTLLFPEDLRSSSPIVRDENSLDTSQNRDQRSQSNRKRENIIVLEVVTQKSSCGKECTQTGECAQTGGTEQASAFDRRVNQSIKAYHSTLKYQAHAVSSPTKIIKNL